MERRCRGREDSRRLTRNGSHSQIHMYSCTVHPKVYLGFFEQFFSCFPNVEREWLIADDHKTGFSSFNFLLFVTLNATHICAQLVICLHERMVFSLFNLNLYNFSFLPHNDYAAIDWNRIRNIGMHCCCRCVNSPNGSLEKTPNYRR